MAASQSSPRNSRHVRFTTIIEQAMNGLPVVTHRPLTDEERAQRAAPPRYRVRALPECVNEAFEKYEDSLRGLKPATKEVLATILACENLKGANYGIVAPDKLKTLLGESSLEIPNTEVGTKGQVVSYVSNLEKMFLRWADQRYRLRLLTEWLTYRVKNNHPDFHMIARENVCVRSICVAPIPSKSTIVGTDAIQPTETPNETKYCRGYCLDNPNEETGKVLIFYQDFGFRGYEDYQNLRKFDHEVMMLPPFSFTCAVDKAQIIVNDSGSYSDVITAGLISFFHPEGFDRPRTVDCEIVKKLKDGKAIVKLYEPLRSGSNERKSLLKFMEEYLKANASFRKNAIRKNLPPPGYLQDKLFAEEKMAIQYYRKLKILKISGQEIYGRIIFDGPNSMFSYDNWNKALQVDYCEMSQSLAPPDVESPQIDQLYVWMDPQTNEWHRVVVLKSLGSPNMFTCWLVDSGEEREVSVKNMKNIKCKYSDITALAVKIHLSHLEITNTKDFERELANLCPPGTMVFGTVLELAPLTAVSKGFISVSHGMVLVRDNERETLQTTLCQKDVAKPCGPAANWFVRKGLPAYYDTHHVKQMLAKVYPEVEIKEECYDIFFDPRKKAAMAYSRKYRLPLRVQHCMSPVFICSPGIGPDGFYVQSLEHRIMLVHMEDVFQKLGPLLPNMPTYPKPLGYIVLARQEFPLEKEKASLWRRVMIIEVENSGEYVTGLFIDYGYVARLHARNLKEFQPYFQQIPPMCQRVHLEIPPGKTPVDPNGWSIGCINAWLNFVHYWLRSESTYYVWTKKKDHAIVRLSEFQQPLAFDFNKGDWIPGIICKDPKFKDFNCLRKAYYYSEQIMEPFFTSVGVTLTYYVVGSNEDKVNFPPVVDFCARHGWLTASPIQPE